MIKNVIAIGFKERTNLHEYFQLYGYKVVSVANVHEFVVWSTNEIASFSKIKLLVMNGSAFLLSFLDAFSGQVTFDRSVPIYVLGGMENQHYTRAVVADLGSAYNITIIDDGNLQDGPLKNLDRTNWMTGMVGS